MNDEDEDDVTLGITTGKFGREEGGRARRNGFRNWRWWESNTERYITTGTVLGPHIPTHFFFHCHPVIMLNL